MGLITTGTSPTHPVGTLKTTSDDFLFEVASRWTLSAASSVPLTRTESLPGNGRNATCAFTVTSTSLRPEVGLNAVTATFTASYVNWKETARFGSASGVMTALTTENAAAPSEVYSGVTSCISVVVADEDRSRI